jgi:hypothetical protein
MSCGLSYWVHYVGLDRSDKVAVWQLLGYLPVC